MFFPQALFGSTEYWNADRYSALVSVVCVLQRFTTTIVHHVVFLGTCQCIIFGLQKSNDFFIAYIDQARTREPSKLAMNMFDKREVLMEPMIDDMFSLSLDSNGLDNPTYPKISVKSYTSGVEYVECDINASLLPMFLHRGSSSGIWFQPNINDRKLHVNNFLSTDKEHPVSLYHTAISPNPKDFDAFHRLDQIAVMPYMLVERGAVNCQQLPVESVCRCLVILDEEDSSNGLSTNLELASFCASEVTAQCLNRVFELFEMKCANPQDPPSLEDYVIF